MKRELRPYFPHDINARNDIKSKALISRYGLAGYGAWWIVLEILRESDDYRIPMATWVIDGLKGDFSGLDLAELLDTMVEIGLLVLEDGYLYSDSLNERMSHKDAVTKQRKIAGKASADARRAGGGPPGIQPGGLPSNVKITASMEANTETTTEGVEKKRIDEMARIMTDDMTARYPVKSECRSEIEREIRNAIIFRGADMDIFRRGLDQFLTEYAPFTPIEYIPKATNWIGKNQWLSNWRDLGRTQRAKKKDGQRQEQAGGAPESSSLLKRITEREKGNPG